MLIGEKEESKYYVTAREVVNDFVTQRYVYFIVSLLHSVTFILLLGRRGGFLKTVT